MPTTTPAQTKKATTATKAVKAEPVTKPVSTTTAPVKAKVVTVKLTLTIEQISQKAYELWQARGSEHGHDLKDWFAAEKALTELN